MTKKGTETKPSQEQMDQVQERMLSILLDWTSDDDWNVHQFKVEMGCEPNEGQVAYATIQEIATTLDGAAKGE